MKKNKTKKTLEITIIIVSSITIIVFVTLFVIRYFNARNIQPIPDGTGAIQSSIPVSEVESYNQLYDLLDKDQITTEFFIINPIPKKRIIEIGVKEPLPENQTKAQIWLKENGYGNIPSDKIIFTESFN